jgi:hypothetical protein
MKSRMRPGTKWAAYMNSAFDSSGFGHLKFLHVGEGCTYPVAPTRLPDTKEEINWMYTWQGWVDLETGEIGK